MAAETSGRDFRPGAAHSAGMTKPKERSTTATAEAAIGAELFRLGLSRLFAMAWRWAGSCARRRRQRLALAELDDRLLGDIGLTRADVARETEKRPWTR